MVCRPFRLSRGWQFRISNEKTLAGPIGIVFAIGAPLCRWSRLARLSGTQYPEAGLSHGLETLAVKCCAGSEKVEKVCQPRRGQVESTLGRLPVVWRGSGVLWAVTQLDERFKVRPLTLGHGPLTLRNYWSTIEGLTGPGLDLYILLIGNG